MRMIAIMSLFCEMRVSTTMNNNISIIAASREDVERRPLVRVPHILISIRDPGTPQPRLRYHGARRDVLHLEFHDAEPSESFRLPPEIRLMADEDAHNIWTFVQKHLGDVQAIVVHCEQGMSRSPAVAAGLLWGLGRSDDDFWDSYMPNAFVFDLMLKCCPCRRINP
jgi:predicted protein tyrosine phosphatase